MWTAQRAAAARRPVENEIEVNDQRGYRIVDLGRPVCPSIMTGYWPIGRGPLRAFESPRDGVLPPATSSALAASRVVHGSWREPGSGCLFAHWPVPEEKPAPDVPPGLTLQTFDGRAWLADHALSCSMAFGSEVCPLFGAWRLPPSSTSHVCPPFHDRPASSFLQPRCGKRPRRGRRPPSVLAPYSGLDSRSRAAPTRRGPSLSPDSSRRPACRVQRGVPEPIGPVMTWAPA